ncbi:MAG TPA: hypothetical protein VKR30_04145 [Candidatus Limnocylindrales bacterium]|nr:hypothetical protein [Candidatus Limnocylindrales bacterium]
MVGSRRPLQRFAPVIAGSLLALVLFGGGLAAPSQPARAVSCSILPCYTLTITLTGSGSGSYKTADSTFTPDGAIDCEEVNGKITVSKCSDTYQDLSPGGTGVWIYAVWATTTGSCRDFSASECEDGSGAEQYS